MLCLVLRSTLNNNKNILIKMTLPETSHVVELLKFRPLVTSDHVTVMVAS